MRIGLYKRCPRCDMKLPRDLAVCPGCQLKFSKFEEATNKEAKVALKQGEEDRVIMRKGFPKDVNKIGFAFLTAFLGFTGAHHYRVGRWKMGLFYSIFFLIGVLNSTLMIMGIKLPVGGAWEIFSMLVIVWGIVLIMWITDFSKVCFNRYKIPVSRER